jgi:hypothetical protein
MNLQTHRDSFPMPLVEDVLIQLKKSQWFSTLDLQSTFWQIKMALEDMCKFALITKPSLFYWTIMPFQHTFPNYDKNLWGALGQVFKSIY